MERSNNLVGATWAEAPNKSEFKIAELNTACFFARLDAVTEHSSIHMSKICGAYFLFICIVCTVHHLRFIYNECQRGCSYLRCCKLCLSARTPRRLPTHPSLQENHFENSTMSKVLSVVHPILCLVFCVFQYFPRHFNSCRRLWAVSQQRFFHVYINLPTLNRQKEILAANIVSVAKH